MNSNAIEKAAPRSQRGSGKHRPKKLDEPYHDIGGAATPESFEKDSLAGPSKLSPKKDGECTAPAVLSHTVGTSATLGLAASVGVTRQRWIGGAR